MRRAFFFIVAVCLATPSFASIPRASAPELSSPSFDALSETRIRVSEDLAPFERPAPPLLSRALRQGYEQASTTNASGLAGFLSVDPGKDWDMHQPQSWNMYSYVRNNPINRTDPTGRWVESAWDIASVVIGAISLYDNVRAGNYGSAALDAGGVVVDVAAVVAPLVPGGVGAAIKGVRAANAADNAADGVSAVARGSRNPKVADLARKGQEAHKAAEYPPGFKKEAALPSGKRMDAYNKDTKEVIELKPNNPRAIKKGEKQVERYCKECDEVYGPGHTGTVRTYEPPL